MESKMKPLETMCSIGNSIKSMLGCHGARKIIEQKDGHFELSADSEKVVQNGFGDIAAGILLQAMRTQKLNFGSGHTRLGVLSCLLAEAALEGRRQGLNRSELIESFRWCCREHIEVLKCHTIPVPDEFLTSSSIGCATGCDEQRVCCLDSLLQGMHRCDEPEFNISWDAAVCVLSHIHQTSKEHMYIPRYVRLVKVRQHLPLHCLGSSDASLSRPGVAMEVVKGVALVCQGDLLPQVRQLSNESSVGIVVSYSLNMLDSGAELAAELMPVHRFTAGETSNVGDYVEWFNRHTDGSNAQRLVALLCSRGVQVVVVGEPVPDSLVALCAGRGVVILANAPRRAMEQLVDYLHTAPYNSLWDLEHASFPVGRITIEEQNITTQSHRESETFASYVLLKGLDVSKPFLTVLVSGSVPSSTNEAVDMFWEYLLQLNNIHKDRSVVNMNCVSQVVQILQKKAPGARFLESERGLGPLHVMVVEMYVKCIRALWEQEMLNCGMSLSAIAQQWGKNTRPKTAANYECCGSETHVIESAFAVIHQLLLL